MTYRLLGAAEGPLDNARRREARVAIINLAVTVSIAAIPAALASGSRRCVVRTGVVVGRDGYVGGGEDHSGGGNQSSELHFGGCYTMKTGKNIWCCCCVFVFCVFFF